MFYAAFDIGNVLCNVDFSYFLKKMEEHINVPENIGMAFLNRLQKAQDLGLTTVREELHIQHPKYDFIFDELITEWNQSVTINKFSQKALNSIIKKANKFDKINIALLSNIGTEHSSIIGNILGKTIYDNSVKHFSCEVGARKPTKLYYQSFLMQYPEFKGCVYVDDRQENLITGNEFGFDSIHLDIEKCNSANELKLKWEFIDKMIFQKH